MSRVEETRRRHFVRADWRVDQALEHMGKGTTICLITSQPFKAVMRGCMCVVYGLQSIVTFLPSDYILMTSSKEMNGLMHIPYCNTVRPLVSWLQSRRTSLVGSWVVCFKVQTKFEMVIK